MNKQTATATRQRGISRGWLAVILTLAILIIDQVIKIEVKTNMCLHQSIRITDWFYINFIENSGVESVPHRGGVGHRLLPVEAGEGEGTLWIYRLSGDDPGRSGGEYLRLDVLWSVFQCFVTILRVILRALRTGLCSLPDG